MAFTLATQGLPTTIGRNREERISFPRFYLPVLACFFLSACGNPVNTQISSLSSSIRARASLVLSLKNADKITEDGKGYLRSKPDIYLNIQERRVVEEENFERAKVFTFLARENAVDKKKVEAIFADKASKSR